MPIRRFWTPLWPRLESPSDGQVSGGRPQGSRGPRALCSLGFEMVREAQQVAMRRSNADGTVTPLTLPNHQTIKSSTLRTICTQSGIPREEFLRAFEQS